MYSSQRRTLRALSPRGHPILLIALVCASLALIAGPTPAADERVEIGGATIAAAHVEALGIQWALFNNTNHLSATPVVATRMRTFSIEVEGFIRDVLVIPYGGKQWALLSTGGKGLVVVDVTDPRRMEILTAVTVNYHQDGVTWTEGGGDIVPNNVVEGPSGSISALATDGVDLWIADEDYGLHRTALSNLISHGGPTLEPDGTLLVEDEVWTLQYAGEIAWGGPRDLVLHDGVLYVAQGFLGLGLYDPVSLERLGGYNLYTDASVVEDWFVDLDVALAVQPGFLDPVTGMPDYNQASFEIREVWHGDVTAPTPWADFDRYGKYYYNANKVAVADFGSRTLAYIAYGLGGLVAVEVDPLSHDTSWLGYAPAVPAHGPEEPTQVGGGPDEGSLFPHYGAGMLKEAGAVDVVVFGNDLYYSDHFAGLTVMANADDPASSWRGPDAPYDNDDPLLGDGVLGDHWPDFEFVTSYDMSPYDPSDHESLPAWMYAAPSLIVTGEVGGHGNALAMLSGFDPFARGTDLVMAVGGGGMSLVDIVDLGAADPADRWKVVRSFATTRERGALANGRSLARVDIGHTQGVVASGGRLYVADGPHGVTAWEFVGSGGVPSDIPHVVANTLQDEYPQLVGGELVYPTPHAYGLVYDPASQELFVLCQGLGMRRLDVSAVEAGLGAVGRPLLMKPERSDIFEHNTENGSVDGTPKQDHAYDVVIEGDLAYLADGGNGLTVYDLTKDPSDLQSGFLVSNLGGSAQGKAELGRSTGIALWYHPTLPKRYAFLAAGPRGVGVVDVSDPAAPELVKVFEPIKIEDGKVGHADGRAVDVQVAGALAYFTYDSFGIVCYEVADLIEALPPDVDPTKIWKVQGGVVLFDYRPEAVGRFKLQTVPGYADVDGGALNFIQRQDAGGLLFHVAYGTAGVATILWTEPGMPLLLDLLDTPGEAASVEEADGRLFVADSAGGLVYFE